MGERNLHGPGAGQVTATFTPMFVVSTENISGWYFNVADAFAGNLIFSSVMKTGTFDTPTFSQGLDMFKADGDGFYDNLLGFTTGGNASKVFNVGDTLSFVMTSSVSGLDASDFDVLSLDAGGHGPFFTAAHVQNTTGVGTGGSGWISSGDTGSSRCRLDRDAAGSRFNGPGGGSALHQTLNRALDASAQTFRSQSGRSLNGHFFYCHHSGSTLKNSCEAPVFSEDSGPVVGPI